MVFVVAFIVNIKWSQQQKVREIMVKLVDCRIVVNVVKPVIVNKRKGSYSEGFSSRERGGSVCMYR